MLIIREVFTAKPGQASKLAKLFKKGFAGDPTTRVMTDMVGDYNTVVVEVQVENLAEFEKQMKDYSRESQIRKWTLKLLRRCQSIQKCI